MFEAIASQRDPNRAEEQRPVQTLLFSATLPKWVHRVAAKYMNDPKTIDLVGEGDGQASRDVKHLCVKCPWQLKPATISDLVTVYGGVKGKCFV